MSISAQIIYRENFERESGVHLFNSVLIPLSGEFEYTVNNIKKLILPYMPVIFKTGDNFYKKIIKPTTCIRIITENLPFFEKNKCLPPDRYRLKQSISYLETAIKNNVSENIIHHLANDVILFGLETENEFAEKARYAAYVDEHFSEHITLSDLAKNLGYSKQSLISNFKKLFNMTPVAYITDIRINNAKKLLLNTKKSVGEIASCCGFENTYYFSNVFKNHTGISPQNFRKHSML